MGAQETGRVGLVVRVGSGAEHVLPSIRIFSLFARLTKKLSKLALR